MKKNIRVNVSGILFNIDEDAYKILDTYLKRLEQHFGKNASGKEIIEDIESGIADMMNEKIKDGKSIIESSDIEEIISKMGDPIEISDMEENENPSSGTKSSYTKSKRLYRDIDERVIAGVCSGLSKYLSIDVVWIRLLFIALIFIPGASVLIYIVLWIAVPEAITTAQKLEMEGEPINIDNIEKKIKDEVDQIGSKLNDLKNKHFSKKKDIGKPIRSIFDTLGRILYGLAKAFLTIIGGIITAVAIFLIIILIPSLYSGNGFFFTKFNNLIYFSIPEIARSLVDSPAHGNLLIFSFVSVLLIPLLAIIIGAMGHLFQVRMISRGINKALGILWIAGGLLLTYSGLRIAQNFDHKSDKVEKVQIHEAQNMDTLYVQLDDKLQVYPEFDEDINRLYDALDNEILYYKEGDFIYSVPQLSIHHSLDSTINIKVIKYSFGDKRFIAKQNIQHIEYKYIMQDSLFKLAPLFQFPLEDRWRAQRVKIKIYLPKDKHVKFLNNSKLEPKLFLNIENEMKYDSQE